MRLHYILRYIGLIFIFNSIFLFISFLISVFNSDSSAIPLFYSTLIALVFGIFPLIFVPSQSHINSHEGIVIVVFSWLSSCLIGSLPYILWGGEFNFTNAWFESVSGYTTTGSSIINNIEALPKGLLFWRSVSQWIGGTGIILFVLYILPIANQSKLVLFNSEMSSIAKKSYIYRTKQILQILLYVYIGLTVLETLFLFISGMNVFDALTHSFTTIATGGFSTKNLSIAYYNNIGIEITIIVFMLLSGIHFGLLFETILGRRNNVFKSPIVKFYLLLIFIGIILVSIKLHGSEFDTWGETIRYSSFQVISLGTSTGFATIDTANWSGFTQLILVFFTLQCACAGSTSGGIKIDRIFILWKTIIKNIKLLQHPHAIIPIKIGKISISDDITRNSISYIILYLIVVFISTLLISALNVDIYTAFSGSAATMGNVGPGFGDVSSLGNYSQIPDAGKWVLTFNMLLGRLEIYGFLSLFMIKSWK